MQPNQLSEWFQSGTATLALLIFGAKYVWEMLHKSKDKNEIYANEKVQDIVVCTHKLENMLQKLTEQIQVQNIRWAEERVSVASRLDALEKAQAELKQSLTTELRINIEKCNDKTRALFDILDGKRALR